MLFRLTARERFALGVVSLLLALGVLGLVIL
jgi:hypothetical protein